MTEIITNNNMLSPFGGKFTLSRTPYLEYFFQEFELPGITMNTSEIPGPFKSIPFTGGLIFEPLTISYKVDEDMNNWLEIFNWITSLGLASGTSGYSVLKNQPIGVKNGLTSDITLSILKSNMNVNKNIVFKDAFPIAMSGLRFNTTDQDVNYIQSSVTFQYTIFEIMI